MKVGSSTRLALRASPGGRPDRAPARAEEVGGFP
jgi:hypothetical protein